jgi:AcrR family transcriptional regulator
MDRVATRAGTSKNVIYRRWPSRAELSVAAYRQMLPTDPDDTPDTGDLRSDALTLLNRANDRLTSPAGKVMRALLSGMRDDPELLREIREQLAHPGGGPWLTILSRAAARGEIGTEALTPRVATVALNLLRCEYGLNGVTSIPPSVLVEIVDQVFLPLVRASRQSESAGHALTPCVGPEPGRLAEAILAFYARPNRVSSHFLTARKLWCVGSISWKWSVSVISAYVTSSPVAVAAAT